jgi:hypothetical protein
MDAIVVRLVESTTATWEQWFAMLTDYADREGHPNVPIGYTDGDWRLGRWVGTQRDLYRRRQLLTDRAARLEALPGWSWSPQAEEWPQGYAALMAFAAREGHADVPKRHVEAGFTLGTWVQHQRTDYRTGALDLGRVDQLEQLPGWVWNTKHERWEKGFALLQAFAAREGHGRVPDLHDEDGFPLGHWVRHQRQLHDRGALAQARQARLEAVVGWVWDIDAEGWERAYRLVEAFAAEEGHARVPIKAVVDGARLGSWIANQRTAFATGRLAPERAARLAALPGWAWDDFDARWDATYDALSGYAARSGSSNPPKGAVEHGFRLGKLDQATASVLEAFPGWSWQRR